MKLAAIRQAFDQLNHDYLAVHRAKEDRFWGTYMGTDTDQPGFVAADQAWNAFLADPTRLASVRQLRQALAAAPDRTSQATEAAALDQGLAGWQALFECHAIESDAARAAWDEVIRLESDLFAQKRDFQPTHLGSDGQVQKASLGMLATALQTNPDEAGRRSSLAGLRSVETWVLDHGFAAIVKARNAFARLQGFADYFEYKVFKTERMTAAQLFTVLDEFEALTRDAQHRSLAELKRRGGGGGHGGP